MSTLIYEQIPNNVFIPVIRRLDIVKARPLSRGEKKEMGRGCPDILLTSPIGEERTITRKELLSSYTYINGKRIKILGWSSNKNYLVVKNDYTELYTMLVPKGSNIIIRSKKISGKYVICLTDEQGKINRNSVSYLSPEMFKKMFQIPEHTAISNRTGKKSSYTLQTKLNQPVPNFNLNEDAFTELASEIQHQPQEEFTGGTGGMNIQLAKEPEQVKTQYMAIGRLMTNGSLSGFIIQNTKGATRNITKQEMMYLCKKKLVSNIMLGRKEPEGTYFLRGNGIRIDMLQSYDV